jgi:NAD(P)H dehydrogenase (quinone)
MKVLVIFYSKSGNTRHLAEEIAAGVTEVKGVSSLLRSASEVTKEEFVSADGIIAGSPVYFGTMAAELKAVFDNFVGVRKRMENKVGAAFATGADESGGKETTMLSIIQAMLIYGMIIVGDPLDASGHYGIACTGAPDPDTREQARKLGRRVAILVKQLNSAYA